MTEELAEALVEVFEWVGQDAEVIEYSGRGMGGRNTFAVKFDDDSDLFVVFYELGRRYGEFLDEVEKLRMDRLGKKFVLY